MSSLEVRFSLYYDRPGPVNVLLDEVVVEFFEGSVLVAGDEDDVVVPEVVIEEVSEAVLPEVGREMTASVQTAVTGRISQAAGGVPGASLQLAGQSSVSDGLVFLGRSLDRIANQDHEPDFGRMLGASSFSLPLAPAGEDGRHPAGTVAVWGSGDYSELSGKGGALSWSGSVTSFHLGADSRPRPDLLTGLAMSVSRGAFDYDYDAAGEALRGRYAVRMTSLFPYAGWSPSPKLDTWAMAGFGRGEVEVEDDTTGLAESADAEMKSAAAGASVRIASRGDLFPGGTTTIRLKSDASLARFEVEDNDSLIRAVTTQTHRLRVGVEGWHERELSAGGRVRPSLEAGLRRDGGDGETGSGIELGGGVRFSGTGRLTATFTGRKLLAHGAGLDEWGVGAVVRLEPRAAGRGLSFDVSPAWGETTSGTGLLQTHGTVDAAPQSAGTPDARLDANVGFGMGVIDRRTLLTPFGGLSFVEGGMRQYRTGVRLGIRPALTGTLESALHAPANEDGSERRFRLGFGWRFDGAWTDAESLDVGLEGTWRAPARAEPVRGLMLRARMRW